MNKAVTKKLPILSYHRIAPASSGKTDPYSITPAQFEEQLSFLKDCGYYSIDWKQWLAAMQTRQPLPGLAIALTFDGGYEDFYQYAWPLLQKYGFSATVFLVAKHVGKTSAWSSCHTESLPLMNWKQVQELQAAGITFGSNTYSHAPLTGLSPDMVVEEVSLSKLNIQKNTGAQVALLAYPYGDVDATTTHLVGATGYTIGLYYEARRSDFFDNPLLLPRFEIKGSDTLSEFIEKVTQ